MRLAFFGSRGLLSNACLGRLWAEHEIVAVVAHRGGTWAPTWRSRLAELVRRAPPTTEEQARRRGVTFCEAGGRDDPAVAELLHTSRPDLICVAGYRWLLSADLLAAAPLGGINLHLALLPRHRGPLPYFWIYYHDDRKAGVTVHWMVDQADAGDIILQHGQELPRGWPVARLNRSNARSGPRLLSEALRLIARGEAPRQVQNVTHATSAPWVRPGTPMVDFPTWDVERVWHFLAGLYPFFREPLEIGGVPAPYRSVLGFDRRPSGQPPGTVRRAGRELLLAARGGSVRLRAP